jgi:hypothetical protein
MVEHDPYMIHFRATFFWTAMFGVQREGVFYGLYMFKALKSPEITIQRFLNHVW